MATCRFCVGPETTAKLPVDVQPDLPARRAASLDAVSLFDTHPPQGLRAAALEALGGEAATVVVSRIATPASARSWPGRAPARPAP